MPVLIGINEIRPAPFVTLSVGHQTLGDGRRVGDIITATLKGTITVDKTNDTVSPVAIEHCLATVISKQEEIRSYFSTNGQWFEIQGLDGSAPVKFIATVDSIEFEEGPWVNKCDWTVVLHGEDPAGEEPTENNHIESADESWEFQEGEGLHTYVITHNLSAKGKTVFNSDGTYTKQAWEYAKDFVTNKLQLGWSTTNSTWSPTSGSSMFSNGNIQPESSFLAYNRIISEQINEADGTYSVTENYTLSTKNYYEQYNISVRKETGNPLISTIVSINGSVHGLTTNLHDPEGKTSNAITAWSTVQSLLYTRLSAYAPDATLNVKYTSFSHEIDTNLGVVTYSCELDDRLLTNHTFEWYNVITETTAEDNRTTVRIDGIITGVRYYDDVRDPMLPYDRALAQFENIKLLLFTRALDESGITDLRAFPVSATVTPDKQAGSISYSFTYDNRIPENVRDEFSVSSRFSREDGRTIVSISGTITGLRSANASWPFTTNDAFERYNNALEYFNGIENGLLGLAGTYVDISKVNAVPYSKQVNHIPRGGQVTYEYEYNSLPSPCLSNVLSQNVTVTDEAATPLVAIIPVIGRADGPVIQNLGTVKEKRRSVTVEIVFMIDVNTNLCANSPPPATFSLAQYAPKGSSVYLEQDQTTWSPTTGHYTHLCSWIYE